MSSIAACWAGGLPLYPASAGSLSGVPKPSFLRRALTVTAIGIFFTGAGFVMTTIPAFTTVNELLHTPSDEETLRMYSPGDDFARDVDDYIRNHPLAIELRSKPDYSESRPHLKVPPSARSHNLTAGTLMGPGKVIVPPYAWSERGGKSLVTISYLGTDLCGHAGIVHGGLLATILDESLARCCFAALPNRIGMTANLNINYRAPVPAGSYIVLRAKTVKVDGRKAWVEGCLESLVTEGEKPILYAEATALFIEPRQAAVSTR